jgi:hypothetical protein
VQLNNCFLATLSYTLRFLDNFKSGVFRCRFLKIFLDNFKSGVFRCRFLTTANNFFSFWSRSMVFFFGVKPPQIRRQLVDDRVAEARNNKRDFERRHLNLLPFS